MALVDYLVQLDTNPQEAIAFKKNATAAMKAAGLSKQHQAILRSRNPVKIREAVFAEQPFTATLCPIVRPF